MLTESVFIITLVSSIVIFFLIFMYFQKNKHIRFLEQSIQEKDLNLNEALREKSVFEAVLEQERKQALEKLDFYRHAKTELAHEFSSLANKLFEEKQQKLVTDNKDNLTTVLQPLREQLKDFKQKVEDVYEKEAKDRVSLFNEITHLKDLNQRISEEATNLTQALKGDKKLQGSWGEMILERVLEEAGLQKGREFEVQVHFNTEEGAQRPDVIIHLPEGKKVIIDAKVTLNAYDQYCSTQDSQEKQLLLKNYLGAIRQHIDSLSAKNYETLLEAATLDFVLIFIPIESAFLLLVEQDTNLFREAFNKNIILVSPTTLLAVLKTIHSIWRSEHQNRNALKIAKCAQGLYEQCALLIESIEELGQKLQKTQEAFDTTCNRLYKGKGNLVNRTLMLDKLGIKGKRAIPQSVQQKLEEIEDPLLLEEPDA